MFALNGEKLIRGDSGPVSDEIGPELPQMSFSPFNGNIFPAKNIQSPPPSNHYALFLLVM